MSRFEVWSDSKLIGHGKSEVIAIEQACHTLAVRGASKEWLKATLIEHFGRDMNMQKETWVHPNFNGVHPMGQS